MFMPVRFKLQIFVKNGKFRVKCVEKYASTKGTSRKK